MDVKNEFLGIQGGHSVISGADFFDAIPEQGKKQGGWASIPHRSPKLIHMEVDLVKL